MVLARASVRVRAARKSSTDVRVAARARPMAASAVRFAWKEVTPKVTPSTARISSADATKILPARPNRVPLVALASGIRGVVLPELVLVRLPAEPARVERDLDVGDAVRPDDHVAHELLRRPLVPHVQLVGPGLDAGDRERPVPARLREMVRRHHLHERHHAGVHVAEHPHQPGIAEHRGLAFAAAIEAEVEAVRVRHREHVVVEGVVIGERHRRADGNDQHVRGKRLVADRDLEPGRCERYAVPDEVDDGVTKVGRWRVVFFLDGDAAAHLPRLRGGGCRAGNAARKHGTHCHDRSPQRLTSKSCAPAGAPSSEMATLYFPTGQPEGFEMWNSVWASPCGAIACVSAKTVWPVWNVHSAAMVALDVLPTVATEA